MRGRTRGRSGRRRLGPRNEPVTAPASAAELLARFCAEAGDRLNGEGATFVKRVGDGLAERQIRLALVGCVSSGKSTLANALIGERVAPTDATECTRLVTCYRYAEEPRTVVHLKAGGLLDVTPTSPGRTPDELPVPAADVAFVEVGLRADPLWHVTLLDTPGISTTDADASQRTQDLFTDDSSGSLRPDAVAFVLTQNVRADEQRLLRRISDAGLFGSAAMHTVGVLTKADLIGGGGEDAGAAADTLAQTIASRHRGTLSTVVPVCGLLAETGNCRILADEDAAALADLADEWGAAERGMALLSVPRFTQRPARVDAADRRRLAAALGLGGVRELLGRVDAGMRGAAELNAACWRTSGLDLLWRAVDQQFRERADALKAGRALSELHTAVHGVLGLRAAPPDRAWMRDRLESIEFDPLVHRVRELEVLHGVLAGQIELPEVLREDLEALVAHRGRPPRALGVASWKEFELDATSAGQRAAIHVVARSYALAAQRRHHESERGNWL